jgi:hypothetical protein
VLITSRTRLRGLPDAEPLRLDVLPRTEAVELFTRLVGPARPLDPQTVATVVDLVGRLPVAVQAVAALVDDSYTEADLAGELSEAKAGIGLLGRDSPVDARVRAAFETSLRRLDPPDRDALLLLGVYPGPSVGVPQFAALAGLPIASARAVLRRLADRNLIAASAGRVGHHRYQMHDLMRAFAREQSTTYLSEQEQAAAIGRLTTWYTDAMVAVVRLRAAAGSNLGGSGVEDLDLSGPAAAHQWIADEQDNLLAYAKVATSSAGVCHRAAGNLFSVSYYASAQVLFDTAAVRYGQAGDRVGEASVRRSSGYVARATGDYQGAAEHFRAAQTTYAEIGDRGGEASARLGLGYVARGTSRFTWATAAPPLQRTPSRSWPPARRSAKRKEWI